MYRKCKLNSNIYTKNLQTVLNLSQVQAKNNFKLEMYVFSTYKQCTKYTKPMQLAALSPFACISYIHRM